MATRDRVVSIPFSKGVDTKVNDIISEDPMVIENARIDTTGVLRKRYGHDSLTNQVKDILGVDISTITAGKYMFNFNRNLYMNDGDFWYQYNTKRSFWNQRGKHKLFNLVLESDDSNNAYEYRDSHTVGNETYAIAPTGTNSIFIKADENDNVLNTSGTFFANVLNDAHDIVYDGTNLFYAFVDSSNSDQITVFKFANDLSSSSFYVVAAAGSVNDKSISISVSDNRLKIFYSQNANPELWGVELDKDLLVTTAPTKIFPVAIPTTVIMDTMPRIVSVSNDTDFTVIYSGIHNDDKILKTTAWSGTFASNNLTDVKHGKVDSQIEAYANQQFVFYTNGLSLLSELDSGIFKTVTKLEQFVDEPEDVDPPRRMQNIYEDADIIRIDKDRYLDKDYILVSDSIEFTGVENIFGSYYKVCDGKNELPLPFNEKPILKSSTITGGGAVSGTYNYLAIYVYTDAAGNKYESKISDGFDVVTVNSLYVDFEFYQPTSFSTDEFDTEPKIEIYRKLSTDTEYHYVTEGFISFTRDLLEDVSANKLIYSDGASGSELENDPAPPSKGGCFHNGRIFLIDATKRNTLRHSKYFVHGIGVAFPEEFNLVIEDNQDREADYLTAVQSMDSKLIMFKNNSVLVLYGEGPDDTGGNSDYTEPEIISTDNGCIEPRSLILTSMGIFYKSNKGIWLLTRAMESVYIGAGVEDFNSETISGVVHLDGENEVRFTTREGTTMVYNYFYKQWTTFVSHEAEASVNYNGKFSHLKANGLVEVEHDSFRDNGAFIPRKVDTGWLKVNNVGAMQRIKRIGLTGEYMDDHNIKVTTYHDYEKYSTSEYTLIPRSSDYNRTVKPADVDYYAGSNDGVYEYNVHVARQQGQSIRIVFEDVDTGATEEGFKMASMSLRAASKRGQYKLVDNKRF